MNWYTFVFGSAALLIQLYSENYRKDDLAKTLVELNSDDNLPRIRKYDFIIVGAGGAGCVLANRLSVEHTVLLLETGGTPPPSTRPALFYESFSVDPQINYVYKTVKQNVVLDSGGIITTREGKMMGGSTSHHGLVYNRGSPFTYDEWAQVLNDPSWEYKNVLEYFKKSEDYRPDISSDQHGRGGLMTVDSSGAPMTSTWLKAGAELGFRTSLDPNGPQIAGFAALDVTKKDGKRVSSYTAFIEPIEKSRRNLRIERYSNVEEILINEEKRAYGVAYTRHGIPQTAHATKEVIVSAGVYGSPILLMKSGIGPSNILWDAGIPVVADLPVGNTLVNQFSIPLVFSINDDGSLVPTLTVDLTEDDFTEYHKKGEGILALPMSSAQAFIASNRAKQAGQSNWGDLTFLIRRVLIPAPVRMQTQQTRVVQVGVIISRPKSKGIFSFNTTNYKAGQRSNEQLAIIDFEIFSEPSDIDVMLEGLKIVLATMENTTAFQKYGTKYIGEKHPSCSQFTFRTDEYWKCFLHQVGTTLNHAIGPCRMGLSQGDPDAVLNSKFRVLGISNLRVVDASAIPIIPNCNTAAPVIMMAEKASHEILKHWKGRN